MSHLNPHIKVQVQAGAVQVHIRCTKVHLDKNNNFDKKYTSIQNLGQFPSMLHSLQKAAHHDMHPKASVRHQTSLPPSDDAEYHLSELTSKMTVLQDKLTRGWANNLVP
jgi:hypothetical protein